MTAPSNAILTALPAGDLAALTPRLKEIDLDDGAMLGEPGAAITDVIFPLSGIISIVAELTSGERVETALIGKAGVLGAAAVFGGTTHISTTFVQMPGKALSARAKEVVEFARERPAIRTTLFAHEQFLLIQAQQSVACNARHQISERLATWLMRSRAASGEQRLYLTQEFLAEMLGVQRASVSLVAGKLQEQGLIRYRRGLIDILDAERLSAAACECHRAVEQHQARLLGPAEHGANGR